MIVVFTNVPVPRIYTRKSDALNPVGAEYLVMDTIKGTPARHNWRGGVSQRRSSRL
ncbi:hypothetical protein EDD22DRAFT_354519 [Suillus occidentalis]|nr:hypothetical protein EDD22DRAFT_354519 [Suillus occidentalis]